MVNNNLFHLISVQNEYKLSEELYIIESGTQKLYSKHKYSPDVFDHHVLHYIARGSGQYFLNDRCCKINNGDGFYCPPNPTVFYYSDNNAPYAYTRVDFNGTKAEEYVRLLGLSAEQPVKTYNLPIITDYLNNIYHALRKARPAHRKQQGPRYAQKQRQRLCAKRHRLHPTELLLQHKGVRHQQVSVAQHQLLFHLKNPP